MVARRLGRSADPAKTSLPLLLLLLPLAHAWDPWNLYPRPPMGFANWNGFGCGYVSASGSAAAVIWRSETLHAECCARWGQNSSTIRAMADALVTSGLRDAGYRTVLIQEW